MIKADFHTHSEASADGGITLEQYRQVLSDKILDVIAITDHNTIDFALSAQAELGESIVVGEEISTVDGDLIGLFLSRKVEPKLTLAETIAEIRRQGGLVYVPHPFEKIRSGLSAAVLKAHIEELDIIEVINGRAWIDNRSTKAKRWAKSHHLPGLASSDAHHPQDLGKTYSILENTPTAANLSKQAIVAELSFAPPSLAGITAPSINRWQKRHQK